MSLSNPKIFEELKIAAKGDMALVYKAIWMTPDSTSGRWPFRNVGRSIDDVKASIAKLLEEQPDRPVQGQQKCDGSCGLKS